MKLFEVLYKVYTGELENGTVLTYSKNVTAATRLVVVKDGKLAYRDEAHRVFHGQEGNKAANGIVLSHSAYNNEWSVFEVPRKEMTLEDIEKELGYPISIQLENKAQKNDEIINWQAIYSKSNKVYSIPMPHDYVNI